MASALIGALRVTLGLDSAAFEKGASDIERRSKGLTRDIKAMGKQWQGIGKTLSVAITAPVLGAAAAVGRMVHGMAGDLKEMRVSAQVAGEGLQEFQRQAYAAKSVGIEYSQLGDIFKDVRERVGEFVVSGSGPLQDAFDAVKGKVKLTVDELRGLSGKDALQLIVSRMEKAKLSTEEMSFVLESLGSDATKLLPLLKNNAQAFDELASEAAVLSEKDAAELDKYNDAMKEMDNSFRKLAIAVVESGLLDAITDLVTRVSGFVSRLAESNPGLLKFGVAVAGVAAALGPIVGLFGTVVKSIAPFISVLRIIAGGQGLLVAAKAAFIGLTSALGPILIPLGAVALAVGAVVAAWYYWDDIVPIVRKLYLGVKTWLQERLGAIFNWVKGKIEAVGQWFYDLYDKVVGHSYVPDMVEKIGQEMAKLQTLMVDPAQKATKKTEKAFRALAGEVQAILDRLFPKIAALNAMKDDLATIDAGEKSGQVSSGTAEEARRRLRREGAGLDPVRPRATVSDEILNAPSLIEGMDSVGDALKSLADKTKVQTVRIADSFKDMAEKTMQAFRGLADAIRGGGFLDILEAGVNLFLQVGSTGLLGKRLAKNINAVPAYAGGTNSAARGLALVGERGPELVRFGGGEQVYDAGRTRGMLAGSDRLQVEVVANNNGFGAVVRNHAGQVVAEAAPSLMQGSAQVTQRKFAYRQSRSVFG